MSNPPILVVDHIQKQYHRGRFNREVTFSLEASFTVEKPSIVGVMGANGAGKTTLFEMIVGTTPPTAGQVLCNGQDIHNVKYHQRDRLAIHYHQSYQVRSTRWTKPAFLMEPASSDYPLVHLFDEPQFNTQDGYIPFMLSFFKRLRSENRLVFMSVHPTEVYQLDIVHGICERFMFVYNGHVTQYDTWQAFTADEHVRQYLGDTLVMYEEELFQRSIKR